MIMISFTFDKKKAKERARNDRVLPDISAARAVCCNNGAAIHYEDGKLRIIGADINVDFDDVNFMSATIVNDQ